MSSLLSGNAVAEVSLTAACVQCRLPLPIRPIRAGEKGQSWACVRCGTHYRAIRLEEAPSDCAGNARLIAPSALPARPRPVDHQRPQVGQPQGVATKPLRARSTNECLIQTKASQLIDEAVTQGDRLAVRPTGVPFSNVIVKLGALPYHPETEAKISEKFLASTQQVESLVATLEEGRSIVGDAHETIVRETLVQATQDIDLFVRLGANPVGDGYPGHHSLHTAMLATAVGVNLGWDRKTLVELGVGCLMHDVGMVNVPAHLHSKDVVLDDKQFDLISPHPFHTFDLLEDHLGQVPLASRMVAYQLHERCDGSGYPRKRKGKAIHDASKVAAIADVYVALVSPRPHRPALMPYYAVEYMLHGVKSGQFDSSSVRALLKTISLFPIGSYVRLSDDRVARVLRANASNYYRPIVEAWRVGETEATPEILDLEKRSNLSIQKPLPTLSAA